jgi:ribonuclease HI
VCWQHGDNDILVLNVDGSALMNPGQAGYDGIMPISDDQFLFSFYVSVGVSNILHA